MDDAVDNEWPRPCAIAEALKILGEKWALLVVREVIYGVTRFDAIQRNTGASTDVLAARLRLLVAEGVLHRRLYQERPKRYEYVLTPAGHELGQVLLVVKHWGDRHRAPTVFGRPPVTFRHKCGETFVPVVACAECGEPVRHGSLAVESAITASAAATPGAE